MTERLANHFSLLQDYLYQLYKNQSLCDLSLITRNGTTLLAHKLVVAAFAGAVRNEVEKWKDILQVCVVVDCEDVILREILEFIYTGKVGNNEELFPLLNDASRRLQLTSLQNYLHKEYQYSGEPERKLSVTHNSLHSPIAPLFIAEVVPADTSLSENLNEYNVRQKIYIGENGHSLIPGDSLFDSLKENKNTEETHTDENACPTHTPGQSLLVNSKESYSIDKALHGDSDSTLIPPTDNMTKRSRGDKHFLREKKTIQSYYQEHFNDSDWSDDVELSNFSDDESKDETWNIESEIKQRDNILNKTIKPKMHLKEPYVVLVRCDTTKHMLVSGASVQGEHSKIKAKNNLKRSVKNVKAKIITSTSNKRKQKARKTIKLCSTKKCHKRYTRENLTRLYQIKHKQNLLKRMRPFFTYSKTSVRKVKKSLQEGLKKKSAVYKAGKISKYYKKQQISVTSKAKLDVKHNRKSNSQRHVEKVFACRKDKMSARKRRMDKIKKKISKLECFLCERGYKSVRNLSTHLIEKHKYTSVKTQKLTGYPKYFAVKTLTKPVCKECNEEFINMSDFRIHCRSVHKKKKLDPDIACTQKGCAEKFINIGSLKKHMKKIHRVKDTENLTIRHKNAKVLLNTTKKRESDDESTDDIWSIESEDEHMENMPKKISEPQNAKANIRLKKINTNKHVNKHAGLRGIPQRKRYTRENLTILFQIKQRKNLLKRKRPLFAFSKQSIRKIKKSLEEYLKKKSYVYSAAKIIKHCKNQQFSVEKIKFGHVCKICNFWSRYASVVKLHAEKHRKKIAKGIFASMKFKQLAKKKKMDKIKKKVLKLECFLCDRKYKEIRNLVIHLLEKHNYTSAKAQRMTGYPKYFNVNTPTKPVCIECSKEFANLFEYRTHCRSVHRKKRLDPDIPCTEKECMHKFINISLLKKHLMQFHKLEDVENFTFRPKDANQLLNMKKMKEFKTRKNMNEIRSNKLNNYGNLSTGMKKKVNKEPVKGKVASENSKIENRTKKKRNRKICLPSKAFRCNICVKPKKFHHKLVYKNHNEVVHMNMFVSKQFMSKAIAKKNLHLNFPSTNDFARISPKSELTPPQKANLKQKGTRFSDDQEYISPVENSCGSNMHKVNDVQIMHQNSKKSIDKKNDMCIVKTEMQKLCKPNIHVVNNKCVLDILADKSPYICLKCGLSFSLYSKLCLHFTKSHVKQQLRQRQIMAKVVKHVKVRKSVFSVKVGSGRNTYKVKSPGQLTCDICNKTFSQIQYLGKHMIDAHQHEDEKAIRFTRNSSSDDSNKKSNHYDNSSISDKPSQTKSRKRSLCTVCHKSFTEVRSVANHLQNVHRYTFEQAREATGYPSFSFKNNFSLKERKCKFCSETFIMLKDLKRHRVEVHGITCKYCNEKFGNKFILKRHGMREHSDHHEEFASMKIKNTDHYNHEDEEEIESKPETVYSCEKCDYSTTKVGYLKFHVVENHPEIEHLCPVCGWIFRHKLLLEIHITKTHGVGEQAGLPCLACDRKYHRKESLRVHQLKVHGIPHPSLKEYKCDIDGCNKICYLVKDLRMHQKTHVEKSVNFKKKFSCIHCDFACSSRSGLHNHVKRIHMKSRTILCDLCGAVFTDRKHLDTHVKSFHSDGQFQLQCESCSFQTMRKTNLWNHSWHLHNKRMAEDHRNYSQCEKCGFQTPMFSKLKSHINKHNDTRNYACDQCDAKFRTSATLSCHKKWKHSSSTQEKCCLQCGYRTKTSSRLNEHIRVQHQLKDVKPYSCPYCDFRCATNANCRKHIMGKHKGEPVKVECDRQYLEMAKTERAKGNTLALDISKQNTTD